MKNLNLPRKIEKCEYEKNLKSNMIIEKVVTFICLMLGFLFFESVMHFIVPQPLPKISLGNIEMTVDVFVIFFFLLFGTLKFFSIKHEENKRFNIEKFENFYNNAYEVEGTYISLIGSEHRCLLFYDNNLNKYEIFADIPDVNVRFTQRPLKCKALVNGKMALITEVYEETKEYEYCYEFKQMADKKNKM